MKGLFRIQVILCVFLFIVSNPIAAQVIEIIEKDADFSPGGNPASPPDPGNSPPEDVPVSSTDSEGSETESPIEPVEPKTQEEKQQAAAAAAAVAAAAAAVVVKPPPTAPAKPVASPAPSSSLQPTINTELAAPTQVSSGDTQPQFSQTGSADSSKTIQPSLKKENGGRKEKKGFGWFSISPQVGYAYYSEASYVFEGIQLTVDQRSSFVSKIHLDLGGDGLAFEITPLIGLEKIGGSFSDLGGGLSGNFLAVGGQVGLAFRGSWGSFYPHLGVGFHSAYLSGDNIEYGVELYGRIPIGFTWYVAKHMAIVAEFAFMYGATGIRGKIPGSLDEFYAELEAETGIDVDTLQGMTQEELMAELQSNPDLTEADVQKIIEDQISQSVKFGNGFAFEFMLGIRFP